MSHVLRSLFRTYSRLLIFAGGLLIGIQVPSFIDQYQKRVDAHFQEVSINISGFQSTANLLFNGDIEALVAYYQNSNDIVFEQDAQSIKIIVDRFNRISGEQAALNKNIVFAALHVVFSADQEFFDETVSDYSYTVPLNGIAVQWGLSIAVLLTVAIDLGLFGCVKCVSMLGRRRRKNPMKLGA